MKYLDYVAMGAASSAYAEASSARAEVAALWEEKQRLRDDIDSPKYENLEKAHAKANCNYCISL